MNKITLPDYNRVLKLPALLTPFPRKTPYAYDSRFLFSFLHSDRDVSQFPGIRLINTFEALKQLAPGAGLLILTPQKATEVYEVVEINKMPKCCGRSSCSSGGCVKLEGRVIEGTYNPSTTQMTGEKTTSGNMNVEIKKNEFEKDLLIGKRFYRL